MKKALLITWLALLLLLTPRTFQASAPEQNPAGTAAPVSAPPQNMEPAPESEDDIFSTTYERELLSRRFFQKSLPPLGRREKIVWSFKTARANVLL
jgi:hypothetical protein